MHMYTLWLIIVYSYNGQPVRSYRVSCSSKPYHQDIRTLERYFKGHIELKNLSAK